MTSRTTTKPKKKISVDADGNMVIEPTLLWKWRAHEAELRAAQLEHDTVTREVQDEITKNPVLSQLVQRKAAAASSLSMAMKEIEQVQAELEKELGISLKQVAFDDKTGRVYNLAEGTVTQEGAQGGPVKPTKTTSSKKKKKR